jgi:glycosyltransferase involved in cell wall biosynthesis
MVSKACVVGQYQVKLEELARHADLELTVVVPPYWRDERGVTPLERAHTNGYAMLVEPMRFNGQFHLHYYPTLPKTIQSLKPDIVHVDEEPYNVATWLALRASRPVGAKTLFFTWQNLCRNYPLPFSQIESFVIRSADRAIAGSEAACRVLRSKHFARPISVIPQFGVDPDLFLPPAAGASLSTFRVGYVGRLVAEKGIDLLLRAASRLNGKWEVHILGGGPDSSRLRKLAQELGIQSRVRFDPMRLSAAIPEYYRTLDAFVLPSISRPNWKEQFGRVLIEAMSCEVPVVGSDCGEIPNVVGEAGLIFREGDVDALRVHLETLQVDLARRRDLGRRGRARVLSLYTQAHVAAETYRVYRDIMGRPSA